MRHRGDGYEEIADALGYSSAGAARGAVERALSRMGIMRQDAAALLDIEVGRLEEVGKYWWDRALDDALDMQARELATRTWLGIAERRAKLLGLDKLRVEVTEEIRHEVDIKVSHDIRYLMEALAGRAKAPVMIDAADVDGGMESGMDGDVIDGEVISEGEDSGNGFDGKRNESDQFAVAGSGGAIPGRPGNAEGNESGGGADSGSAAVYPLLPARSVEQS